MVVALLATILLAALVFYIFNIGVHVNKRMETQNAADASVKAGAGWVARKMNLVSMHNVEMTRTLAMIQIKDALPEATRYTLADTQAALDACERQLTQGNPRWVKEGLEQVRDELQAQYDHLDEIRILYDDPNMDVRSDTHYHVPEDAPFPGGTKRRGRLWQAMEAMDALSVASMESLGELAVQSAQRSAEINQRDDDKGVVFMPANPSVPWIRTTFEDFHRPLTEGLLPKHLDDPEVRRGPYDTIFGLRDPIFEERLGLGPGGARPVDQRWKSPWSQKLDVEPPSVTGRVVAYRVYGPYEHMMREFQRDMSEVLPHSTYYEYTKKLADTKLQYLIPGAARKWIVTEPDWDIDYERAKENSEEGTRRPVQGQYIVLDFTQEQRLTPSGLPIGIPSDPLYRGWAMHRPTRSIFNPPRLKRIAQFMWEDEQVDDDLTIGIRIITKRYYVFAGADFGSPVPVRNPNNIKRSEMSALSQELPAPLQLDSSNLSHDDEVKRLQHLTFGTLAHQDARAQKMSDGFDGPKADLRKPHTYVTAVAQAEVFNNHSWDLWTQMWHSQLVQNNYAWIDHKYQTSRTSHSFDFQPVINIKIKMQQESH